MIKARAYAKINWALDILATRENGYHELDMLMQSISLHDALTFEEADELTLITDGQPDPYADKNLIIRAARLLKEETGYGKGAFITLTKNTPAMAGLGGGSADCAAAFLALNRLWRLNLPLDRLLEMGFRLGADVPFCLTGGLSRVGGLGEKLQALSAAQSPGMILVMPDGGLSTGAVFGEYDRTARGMEKVDMEPAQTHLLRGDYAALNRYAQNVLTGPAMHLSAAVGQAISAMLDSGAVMARMSGSGSAVFGVFDDEAAEISAWEALKEKYAFCERIRTMPTGVELEMIP